jgi:hypothetical protein
MKSRDINNKWRRISNGETRLYNTNTNTNPATTTLDTVYRSMASSSMSNEINNIREKIWAQSNAQHFLVKND